MGANISSIDVISNFDDLKNATWAYRLKVYSSKWVN